eukprot:3839851-Rhodomonas_salina.2
MDQDGKTHHGGRSAVLFREVGSASHAHALTFPHSHSQRRVTLPAEGRRRDGPPSEGSNGRNALCERARWYHPPQRASHSQAATPDAEMQLCGKPGADGGWVCLMLVRGLDLPLNSFRSTARGGWTDSDKRSQNAPCVPVESARSKLAFTLPSRENAE